MSCPEKILHLQWDNLTSLSNRFKTKSRYPFLESFLYYLTIGNFRFTKFLHPVFARFSLILTLIFVKNRLNWLFLAIWKNFGKKRSFSLSSKMIIRCLTAVCKFQISKKQPILHISFTSLEMRPFFFPNFAANFNFLQIDLWKLLQLNRRHTVRGLIVKFEDKKPVIA